VKSAYHAVEANRAVLVTGGVNKLLATTAQIMPGPLARKIMKSQSKRFRQAD
jgi:short-subunit dehydrogenase